MTWREDLRRVSLAGRTLIGASFRGVPFLVETVELSTGRRLVVHEFPLRDNPFIEDLGRSARRFRVEGYVIGDDYLAQKNALLTALEAAGPGELVLPYYEVKRAIGETVSTRETRSEGGLAVIAIDFVETPAQSLTPTEVVDSVEQVAASADAAVTATKAEFEERYDPDGLPAFALESASSALSGAAAALGGTLAPVAAIAGATQELATLTGQVALLTATASSLARQPDEVVDAFLATISGLAGTIAAAPGGVMDALIDAYATDLGPAVAETTATRVRERANQLAMEGALRRVMAIEAARLAPTVPYASIEEAFAARDAIAALLEEQAAGAGDTAYPALVDLRSQVLRAVPGGATFARVVTVDRRVPIPSLLLAYQLYGPVDLVEREADILARNSVRHPGFVSGALKVLSDAG